MTGVPYPRTGRAAQMRAEFDSAFARPPQTPPELADVLALRLDTEPAVLRLPEVSAVVAHPVLTAVPTRTPALLGVISNRGAVVAVYDLGLLLGGPALVPDWLVITAAEPSVAVAFEHFDGYRRIDAETSAAGLLIEMSAVIASIRALTHHPQSRSGDRP